MVKINSDNLKSLIKTLQGIMPANYASMDRLVTSVNYLQDLLNYSEEKEKAEEVTEDG